MLQTNPRMSADSTDSAIVGRVTGASSVSPVRRSHLRRRGFRYHGIGTLCGTPAKKRDKSRSVLGTAGCKTVQVFMLPIRIVFASCHRQTSTWPSAKLKVHPLLWRVAGKLIQVQRLVPNSHH